MNNDLQEQLEEAANWIQELADNVRSGAPTTVQQVEDLTMLTTELSKISPSSLPESPVKRKRKKNKSEPVSMGDLEPISMEEFLAEGGKLPSWAIPRGAK
jgi:hypothetical protein